MRIETEDGKRTVNIGGGDIWNSVYSTVRVRLKDHQKEIPLALRFFERGRCEARDAMETARQINLIRDMLARYSPDEAVYDFRDPKKKAPWGNNISYVITSCANLYTTVNGQDLLYEAVSILCYAGIREVPVAVLP